MSRDSGGIIYRSVSLLTTQLMYGYHLERTV